MKPKLLFTALLNLSIVLSCPAIDATNADSSPLVYKSGEAQVHLLELYSSEGCSSCPPAEKWLGQFRGNDRLWRKIIPVAFHVNYWDYIGWHDPFASNEYSQRQRNYARSWKNGRVYTPGFVLDGKEWRGWFKKQPLSTNYINHVGSLKITVTGENAAVEFTPLLTLPNTLLLNLAILGFDLASDISSGENRGRKLRHDFVVLGHKQELLENINGVYQCKTGLPTPLKTSTGRLAIAGWTSKTDDPTPLQSVGGWLR